MAQDILHFRGPEPAVSSGTGEVLLTDVKGLNRLTSLSIRTLRRMDSVGDIPGRVTVGRRVLFQVEVIREWVRAGLPDREQWNLLQLRNGKR